MTLLSGRTVPLLPQPTGWARMARLPVTSPTADMYEFAAWAAKLPDGKVLKNREGLLEMRRRHARLPRRVQSRFHLPPKAHVRSRGGRGSV